MACQPSSGFDRPGLKTTGPGAGAGPLPADWFHHHLSKERGPIPALAVDPGRSPWADQPFLLLLQFLAQRLHGSRLMVLGCYRDVEVSRQHPLFDTQAQLSREPAFQRLLLRGWSQDDTRYFVELTCGIRP